MEQVHQKARGEIWGDARFQFQRRAFIDNALLAGSLATKWVNALPIQTQMSICELSDWHIHRGAIATIGRNVDPQALAPRRVGAHQRSRYPQAGRTFAVELVRRDGAS